MMNQVKSLLARFRRDECGGSAVEFAIVATVFIIASMGILELGRAYQVRNELAYAADIGGRRLSIITNNASFDVTDYEAEVTKAVTDTFQGYELDRLTVSVVPETINGINYQKLTLAYPLSVFIPLRSGTYDLQIVRRAVQL